MLIQSILRKTLKFFAWLLLLLAILFGLAVWRILSGPIDLSYFKNDVATAISQTRGGREVALDGLVLEWINSERRLRINATDLKLLDDAGASGAEAESAEITLAGMPLLRGRLELIELHLKDGTLLATQLPDKSGWVIGGERIMLGETKAPTEDMISTIETALGQALQTLREQSEQLRVETVSMTDFTVLVETASAPEPFRLAPVNATLDRSETSVDFTLAVQSEGELLPANAGLGLSAPADFSRLSAELSLIDITPSDLARRLGFELEGFEGLTSEINLGASLDESGRLTSAQALLDVGEGIINLGVEPLEHTASNIEVTYNRTADQLSIIANTLETSRLAGPLNIVVNEAIEREDLTREFTLVSDTLGLDLTPGFDRAWSFTDVEGTGRLLFDEPGVSFDSLTLTAPTFKGSIQGSVSHAADIEPGQIPFNLDIVAEVKGQVGIDEVLRYWPVNAGPRTRNYLTTRVLDGALTEAIARINIRPDSRAAGHLADEALNLDFAVRDASVQFLTDMPPIESASVTAKMTGNTFRLDYTGGNVGTWQVKKGFVHYTQLHPAGEDMIVEVEASGDASEILSMVSDSRLQLQARTGFDPQRITGPAEFKYRMVRPARPDSTFADMKMFGEGRATNAKFSSVFNGLDLEDAVADISLTESGMTVTGYGDLGPSPVTFTWADQFQDDGEPAKLQATAALNADVLNTFGVPGRAFLSGEVPVNLTAGLNGTRISTADIEFDFAEARVSIDDIDWVKEAGEPATGQLFYGVTPEGPEATAQFASETTNFDGNLVLGSDGRIISADLERAFIQDKLDVTGTIRRDEANNVSLLLKGALLDVSDLLAGSGGVGVGLPTSASPADQQSQENDEPGSGSISLSAEVDHLILNNELDIRDADLTVFGRADRLQSLDATGTTSSDAFFIATYRDNETSAPILGFSTGDAGFLTNALMGVDNLSGGKLDVRGRLAYQGEPAQFDITLTDAQLRNAPVFAQILSLASLQGLSDTLNGDGVMFTEVSLPLTIDGSVYSVSGGRASGPAIGLTAKGWVDLETRTLDVNGVLVPSFGLNSALGGIPLVGDLVVGRRGEGIFSLTYAVDGTLEEALVSINPLSAITPGILRRLFEQPERNIEELRPPAVAPVPQPAEETGQ